MFPTPQDRDRCLEWTRMSSPAQVAGSQCTHGGSQLTVKHVDRIFSFDLDQPAVETAAKLDQLLCLLADAPLCVHLVRGNAKGSAAIKRVENLAICDRFNDGVSCVRAYKDARVSWRDL